MTPNLLTAYVMVWPLIVAFVLLYLVRAFHADWLEARAEKRPMI
ncbi:putative transporter small subunit [Devosia sp. 2618]